MPSDLLPTHGITLRLGFVHHFELRVDGQCTVGKVLRKALSVPILSDAEGSAKSLKLLRLEKSSQETVSSCQVLFR